MRVSESDRTPLYVVVTGPLEIGRGGPGLLLDDPGISRRHLVLEPAGDGLVVSDAGSTNGTTVDGAPLCGPHRLEAGQAVRFGACSLELVSSGGASGWGVRSPRATSIDLIAAAMLNDPAKTGGEQDAGTVTIVFAAIEGSTVRAVDLGDVRWMAAVSAHNTLVRSRLARHGGREVMAQGDGFMLCFPSARRALACMIDVQRGRAAHGRSSPIDALRVRVGLHTGEVIRGDDGDLFGRQVVTAAGIANLARGGEILVSSVVREIVETGGDVAFGPPRSEALKGMGGTQMVHPVLWDLGPGSGLLSSGGP